MVAPERETPNGEGEESQRTLLLAHEDVSTTVTRVVEIDIPQDPEVMLPPEDWALVKDYLSLLLNESNLPHFVGIVKRSKQKDTEGRDIEVKRKMTTQDFIGELRDPSVHMLTFRNEADSVLGYAIIRDPSEGQHETWIEKLVVRNRYQNKRSGERPQPRIGTQILEKIKDYVFETPTFDDRPREILYAGVVMFVPNWERTDHLFTKSGFVPVGRWQGNADVLINGEFERKDSERLMLKREMWEAEKAKSLLALQGLIQG